MNRKSFIGIVAGMVTYTGFGSVSASQKLVSFKKAAFGMRGYSWQHPNAKGFAPAHMVDNDSLNIYNEKGCFSRDELRDVQFTDRGTVPVSMDEDFNKTFHAMHDRERRKLEFERN